MKHLGLMLSMLAPAFVSIPLYIESNSPMKEKLLDFYGPPCTTLTPNQNWNHLHHLISPQLLLSPSPKPSSNISGTFPNLVS